MEIRVYHNTLQNPKEVDSFGSKVAKYEVELVAISKDLDCDASDEIILPAAYHDSNHIDCSWTENEIWDSCQKYVRSTCIGDWITIDGRVYQVATVGFTKLDKVGDNVDPALYGIGY